MIVMAIVAVLMGIASLSYLSMRPRLLLSGATRQMMGDLMAARMEAISQHNEFKVFFINTQEYQILDDNDGNGNADPGEWIQTKNIQKNYPGVTFNPVPTNNPIFFPKGTANPPVTITLANTAGSKNVSISISGRVKIN